MWFRMWVKAKASRNQNLRRPHQISDTVMKHGFKPWTTTTPRRFIPFHLHHPKRKKLLYAEPLCDFLNPSATISPASSLNNVESTLTFVRQRAAGSYFHVTVHRLSRSVNHLVVGKSDDKFLKLSHDSVPLPRYSATAAPCSYRLPESYCTVGCRAHLLLRPPPSPSICPPPASGWRHWEWKHGTWLWLVFNDRSVI